MAVQNVVKANSREEVRQVLEGKSEFQSMDILRSAIYKLNYEIERDISMNQTQVALLKLNRVTMLEEVYQAVENRLLKTGVLL